MDSAAWLRAFTAAGRSVAAPSWVIADTLPANCRFLEGRVHEIGLLFFESDACLAYGRDDLPPDLAGLDVRWHVHLPLDLPWHTPHRAADICVTLMEKVAGLGARRVVLHPPQPGITLPEGASEQQCAEALHCFATRWIDAGFAARDCLLENVRNADLVDVLPVIQEHDFSVCLDTGHVLSYRQDRLLAVLAASGNEDPCGVTVRRIRDGQDNVSGDSGRHPLAARIAMVHLNAPMPGGPQGKHAPLTLLDAAGYEAVRCMLAAAGPDATLMMELFRWADVEASMPVVARMLNIRVREETQ